ncbi:hypothetical protein THASP1DRAFT_30458 [Thamnocephalis sphaerospora]|uniref:tRNA-splicing endonuclease subunit Sen34 n=1 Tax=Thamnocephalis sphaerospora TaxID=78915 RepID=A0A4P9XP14_9FUNG|nr:hypothetical protein THASP1DRAFT_30458 [Thamnocephalis sphaerospora]|eukprot:RKP07733.1 hypothetical protein THASP1DRAFT_30458 [Thamnocephalis sphaerospora]
MPSRIRVHVLGEDALVWQTDDLVQLRDEYRITGTLVESLPRQPLQNILHGLPLALLPEEVTLLLALGVVRLVDETRAYRAATDAELAAYQRQRVEEEEARDTAVRAERTALTAQHLARIDPQQVERPSTPVDEQDSAVGKAVAAAKPPAKSVTVHLPTAVPADAPWHSETLNETAFDTLASARSAGVWLFPRTAAERRRLRVYHDLWRRGWWLGSGLKFGGDYLAYTDDPRQCHSTYVVSVCAPSDQLTFTQLVGLGRLGTAVRKARLVATAADETDKEAGNGNVAVANPTDHTLRITYLRIEWAGW